MVVVGVESLGQIEGSDGFASSRHGEVAVAVNRPANGGEPRRDGTHHDRGVEHVIIEGDVVRGYEVHIGGGHALPVAPTDRRRDQGIAWRMAGTGPTLVSRTTIHPSRR